MGVRRQDGRGEGARERLTRRELGTLVAGVLGSGMVFLDATIVNVALPRIGVELQSPLVGTLEAQSYVYNVYLLSLSALLIAGGAVTDRFGRRRTFTLGLIGFGVTSALCGAAPTIELLIAFRLLQGVAGALLVPGSLAILTAGFEGERQGRAFGVWAAASAVTTIVGPFAGGVLVDQLSWRWVFLVNIPLALVGVWMTLRYVDESRDESATARLDWVGSAIVTVAVGGLALGAMRGEQQQWQEPGAVVALAVGIAATVVLPIHLRRSRAPLIPPELFRSRNFSVTNVSTLLIYGGLYVVIYVVTLYLQGTLGYTATAAGLATVPMVVFLALFSTRFGVLADRYGPRRFMAAGPALMALGTLGLVRVDATGEPWLLGAGGAILPPATYVGGMLPGLTVFGIGLAVLVAPLTTALMRSVPVRHSGVGSAVNNAISRVGPQFVGAAVFVVLTATFYGVLADRVPAIDASSEATRDRYAPLNPPPTGVSREIGTDVGSASTSAFHRAMVVCALMFAAGAIVNGWGIRDEDVRSTPDGMAAPARVTALAEGGPSGG